MKMTALLLAGACGLSPMLCAQQPATPVVSLKAMTKGETPLSHPTATTGPAMCDAAGNVYAFQPNTTHRPPIQETTPEARLAGNFRLPDAFPGDVRGGFVDNDGRVYMVVNGYGIYVVEFAQDGSVKAKTRLAQASTMRARRASA